MSTKRYIAETWEEALRLVKEELGDSAVILHSKQFKEGGVMGVGQRNVVEITASNDPMVVERGEQSAQERVRASSESGAIPTPRESGDALADKPNYSRLLEKAYALAATRGEEGASDAAQPRTAGPQGPQAASGSSAQSPTSVDAESARAPASVQGSVAAASSSSAREQLFAPRSRGDKDAQIESLTNDVAELKALVAKLATNAGSPASGVSELGETIEELYRRLQDADVSADRAREIARTVARELTGDQLDDESQVRAKALEVIERMVPVGGALNLDGADTSVIAMIGPTGVGKTTTLSKLAANLIISKRELKVGFITIDTYRLGATEQLRTLAGVLNVPVRVVMTPKEMEATVRELSQMLDVIFIDTAGRSQRDRMKMNELKTFLEAAKPNETHLCVSATTHPVHLMASLDQFGELQVDRLILTKLDEAATYGSSLDVVMRAKKPISYLTVGQDIPDDIELATGSRLARLLLGVDVLED